MTFLVTLTNDSMLFLEIWAFLDQHACIFTTIITKRSILIRFEALMFCIGCYGHIPDEYQPDKNEKKWFQPNLTISITMASATLQCSGFITFRDRPAETGCSARIKNLSQSFTIMIWKMRVCRAKVEPVGSERFVFWALQLVLQPVSVYRKPLHKISELTESFVPF